MKRVFCGLVLLSVAYGQTTNPNGAWKGTFADSIGAGGLTLQLETDDKGKVFGSFRTTLGGTGSVEASRQESELKFELKISGECSGGYLGKLTINEDRATGEYSGTDCQGAHSNGVISIARETETTRVVNPAPVSNALQIEAPAHIRLSMTRPAPDPVPATTPISVSPPQDGEPFTLRSIAYRVVPQSNTTYIQSGQYSSNSNCYGQGYDYGAMSTLNMNCSTNYTTPTNTPITWNYADVYNVMETPTQVYVIGCRAAWRWSKCSWLIPGQMFQAQLDRGDVKIRATNSKGKEQTIKYRVFQVTPK